MLFLDKLVTTRIQTSSNADPKYKFKSSVKKLFVPMHLKHDTDISNFLFVDTLEAFLFIETAAAMLNRFLIENLHRSPVAYLNRWKNWNKPSIGPDGRDWKNVFVFERNKIIKSSQEFHLSVLLWQICGSIHAAYKPRQTQKIQLLVSSAKRITIENIFSFCTTFSILFSSRDENKKFWTRMKS